MVWIDKLIRATKERWKSLFFKERVEEELDEEIRFHIEMQVEKYVTSGVDRREARRKAYVDFGGIERFKEEHRDARGVRLIEDFLRDVSYGVRALRRGPGFTAVAVLALALGIGSTTTVFSSVNALVLRPLPFPDLDEVVTLLETAPRLGFDRAFVSPANFVDWQQQRIFDRLAAYRSWAPTLTGSGEPERTVGYRVSPDFFPLLGTEPHVGRIFLPGEDQPGRDGVAVLSHGFWQRRFGADPGIVGQPLRLDDREMLVVGIMPSDLDYPLGTDLWIPLALTAEDWAQRGTHNLRVVGRLAEEMSLQQARTEMDSLAARLAAEYPPTNAGRGVHVELLREDINFGSRRFLAFLMGAASFLMLLACANVANLQLARATTRKREMAVRLALGAGRFRLVRQLLTESFLLCLAAAGIGILLADWGNDLAKASVPPEIARFIVAGLDNIHIDGWVLGFTTATALVAMILFGLFPAVQSSKTNLSEALKEGGIGATPGPGRRRLRNLLVVTEVALSIVLLVGAGLMAQGFAHLSSVDLGFDEENLLALEIQLPENRYPEDHHVAAFVEEGLGRLESLPGVDSVAMVNTLPAIGGVGAALFRIEGRPEPEPGDPIRADLQVASESYFQTFGIPRLRGREFTSIDGTGGPPVAIVSATLARRYWADGQPIGQRIRLGTTGSEDPWLTIVGVVDDVSRDWLQIEPAWTLYLPFQQAPTRSMRLIVRASSDPSSVVSAALQEIRTLDSGLAVSDTRTVEEILADLSSGIRLATAMMGVFAGIAFLLCASGVYALLAYTAARRTHEVGVRIALGARQADVLMLFVAQGLRLTAIGLLIGLPAAYALTLLLSSFLLGVLTIDGTVFVGLASILLVVATLASYVPARKAARVDPLIAIRSE